MLVLGDSSLIFMLNHTMYLISMHFIVNIKSTKKNPMHRTCYLNFVSLFYFNHIFFNMINLTVGINSIGVIRVNNSMSIWDSDTIMILGTLDLKSDFNGEYMAIGSQHSPTPMLWRIISLVDY